MIWGFHTTFHRGYPLPPPPFKSQLFYQKVNSTIRFNYKSLIFIPTKKDLFSSRKKKVASPLSICCVINYRSLAASCIPYNWSSHSESITFYSAVIIKRALIVLPSEDCHLPPVPNNDWHRKSGRYVDVSWTWCVNPPSLWSQWDPPEHWEKICGQHVNVTLVWCLSCCQTWPEDHTVIVLRSQSRRPGCSDSAHELHAFLLELT